MPFEFGEVPGNLHFSKHGEVSGGVCGVGVKERAVPVEENAFETVVAGVFHEGLCRHIRTFQVYGKTGRPRKSATRSRGRHYVRSWEFRARGEVVRTDWSWPACSRLAHSKNARLPSRLRVNRRLPGEEHSPFETQGKQERLCHEGKKRKKEQRHKVAATYAREKSAYESGAGVVSGDVVVAIEFQFVERGGNAEPAGHSGRFEAGDAGFADDDHISTAHGTADQDHFQFDDSVER